jgi:hypothetical protein
MIADVDRGKHLAIRVSTETSDNSHTRTFAYVYLLLVSIQEKATIAA